MEVIIQPDAEAAARIAAGIVARLVRQKPDAVLGLATGSTQLALYRELVRLHREEELDFSLVTTFNLDEYVGLAPSNPRSYHAYMQEHLFRHVNLAAARVHLLDGTTTRIPEACAEYETAIAAAGGIDLQILGIGAEGHIGFNEPTSSLGSRTRIKTLADRTREDNSIDFGGADAVPRHVLTMGIGTIMDARSCMLLASGEGKARAVASAVEGPVTAMVPASALQMHPAVRFVLDEGAAADLSKADYFRATWEGKPHWQRGN